MIFIFKLHSTKKSYPFWTTLVGLFSFLFCGIIIGLISLITNEGIMLILGVPLGSLLMFFIIYELDKSRFLSVFIRSLLGGLVGVLVGFLIGELFFGVITLLFPSLSYWNQQILPNIMVLIVADAIFGSIMAQLYYGRKAVIFFISVCAITSIPFGLLLSMSIDLAWLGFDQNLLFIVTSFGTSTGLSIGLYSLLRLNKNIS